MKGVGLDMPTRIKNYEQICELIKIPYDTKAKIMFKILEREGHTERSICFAIWKEGKKLRFLPKDDCFWREFIKIIKKWSWPEGDPRWKIYHEKQKQQAEAEKKQKELKSKILKESGAWGHISGHVYFIQGESGGPVKIGYTTDIKRRLKELQSGSIDILQILLVVPGNKVYEQYLHSKFENYRLKGEWYKPDPKIFEYMDKLREMNSD